MKKVITKTTATLLLAFVVLSFVAQPTRYTQVFFDGLTVWAHNVLPVLFPFALLTTIFAKVWKMGKVSIAKILFKIPCDQVWIASFLCGYPVGARAISEQNVDCDTASAMCSFCSTASPIFIIATVSRLIANTTATIIICLSQVIAMALNGWMYTYKKQFHFEPSTPKFDAKDFSATLTNSILAVLSVGGLIAVFFVFAEMIQSVLPASVANHPALFFGIGLLEMTSGIVKICQNCDLFCTTVCVAALLSFGGICVALQCFAFLSQKGASLAKLLKMKCTQSAFATLVAFVLAKIFL